MGKLGNPFRGADNTRAHLSPCRDGQNQSESRLLPLGVLCGPQSWAIGWWPLGAQYGLCEVTKPWHWAHVGQDKHEAESAPRWGNQHQGFWSCDRECCSGERRKGVVAQVSQRDLHPQPPACYHLAQRVSLGAPQPQGDGPISMLPCMHHFRGKSIT